MTFHKSREEISCSDSNEPATESGDRSETPGAGTVDPNAGTFVLKTFDIPPPNGGPPIPVKLVGSNLIIDPDSNSISIDVAIGNLHDEPLFAPAVIWLSQFVPSQTEVLNPDLVMDPPSPGETSEPKTWIFRSFGGVSFSFAVKAEFGMVPHLPRIAGLCWRDANRNGIIEPPEHSLGWGVVNVRFPNGEMTQVTVGPDCLQHTQSTGNPADPRPEWAAK